MQDLLETDYLIVGAGAMGMAFADALLQESDARIVIVDRHARPGGHWNDAYGYVRLHHPSTFYGVNSTPLGADRKDADGLNRGLYEMASRSELLDYFGEVMDQKLLASGRVQYLALADYEGPVSHDVYGCHSLVDGRLTQVRVHRKVVHATHTETAVPSTHPPRYGVAPGVRCVAPNALPALAREHTRYTVVGSGKTGIDACLWLLQNGTPADRIRWIMPNDAWFLDRANVQPGPENIERFFGSLAAQFECIADADSRRDLFERLEARGELVRLDLQVWPTKYRCATVSQDELSALRRIRNVVRQGRVQRIELSRVVLEHGTVGGTEGDLYIDCSARALSTRAPGPVFEGEHAIHLHYVRTCSPTFSAAMIAAVECLVPEAEKNALCRPVPKPSEDVGWLQMWAVSMENRRRWTKHAPLMRWLEGARLDYSACVRTQVPVAVMQRYADAVKAAAPRMPELLRACESRSEERALA